MARWVIGRCKYEDCRWVVARLERDRFSNLRITEEMIAHTEATGHRCTMEFYQGQIEERMPGVVGYT